MSTTTETLEPGESSSEKEPRKLANAKRSAHEAALNAGVKKIWKSHAANIEDLADELGVSADIIYQKVGHFGEESRKTLAPNPWNGFKSIMSAQFNKRECLLYSFLTLASLSCLLAQRWRKSIKQPSLFTRRIRMPIPLRQNPTASTP